MLRERGERWRGVGVAAPRHMRSDLALNIGAETVFREKWVCEPEGDGLVWLGVANVDKVHAVIGGFHLTASKPD